MSRLVVRSNQSTFVCLVILGLIFIPLSLGNFWQLRHGFRLSHILWGLPVLLFAPVLYLVRRGHSRSVKEFAEDGLTRNDGYRFSWADLDCVIDQIHRQNRRVLSSYDMLWRTEIHFKNGGCAWLIPNKIANYAAVSAYTAALPCEHKTVRV
jgi:hypothetical protein